MDTQAGERATVLPSMGEVRVKEMTESPVFVGDIAQYVADPPKLSLEEDDEARVTSESVSPLSSARGLLGVAIWMNWD